MTNENNFMNAPAVAAGILGEQTSEKDILRMLKADPVLYYEYQGLSDEFKQEFLGFAAGRQGLKITYDPFFRFVFDAERNPERLSAFLSSLLGEPVTVKHALPLESSRIVDEGSLVIMDIVVTLKDGSLANVEIQKNPYLFPGQRGACYSADLVLRQYSSVRSERKRKFKYGDLKNVYTIVILENSTSEFKKFPHDFIHRGEQTFNTGLKLELLQKYIYISLDIFFDTMYNETVEMTELHAWLLFLSSDRLEDILRIVSKYPSFLPLYSDIREFRRNVKEVLNMFSDALRTMDRNTVQYMIEEQKAEIEQNKAVIEQSKAEIEQNKAVIEQSKAEIEQNKAVIEQSKAEIEQNKAVIEQSKAEIDKLSQIVSDKDKELEQLRAQLALFQNTKE